VTDPERFSFSTTADLEPYREPLGQERALEALTMGSELHHEGYNLYVSSSSGSIAEEVAYRFLTERARHAQAPPDYCYVNNFEQSHEPRTLRLPPGRGKELRADMEQLLEDLSAAIPEAFSSEDYRTQKQALDEELNERQQNSFEEIQKKAENKGISIVRTPAGLAFAPMKDGQTLNREQIEQLPKEEQEYYQNEIAQLQKEFQARLNEVPSWRKEYREKLKELDRNTTQVVVDHHIGELKEKYRELEEVSNYLDEVREDLIANYQSFLTGSQEADEAQQGNPQAQALQQQQAAQRESVMRRYKVNVFVDNGESEGSPVIYEDQPNYANLFGRIDHIPQYGALLTDFTLLRPGSLHKANGGYLLVDVQKLLMMPFCWEELKRALRAGELRFSNPTQNMGVLSTVMLQPEPIGLDVKVVLLGDRLLHHLLATYDPEFEWLFKISADFEDDMPREDNTEAFARFVAAEAQDQKLRPVEAGGVARVLEYGARLAEDAEKLTAHTAHVRDLLREADYFAGRDGADRVTAEHVQQAVDAGRRRSGRIKERIQEEIRRGTILIDTAGGRVGQVNGLTVAQVGRSRFGSPVRITARVRPGRGNVVDIEREAKLGGPIHSKGVMILSGFLGSRYGQQYPFTLSATLVFEQSYGGVEGDSATLAEACALLSAVSELPLRQDLAITGSINQHGDVQAVGGVNEKIEGFYEVCRQRGFEGAQGVIIPESNVKHLMLDEEVVAAAREGRFLVYAVSTVDEAISLLSGTEAGAPDEEGTFPTDSVNGKVAARLEQFAERARALYGPDAGPDQSERE
jgi:lon-related putative ATP-dependent protease